MSTPQKKIIVIGAGAAGMMAAIAAAEAGARACLIEPNEKVGRKLYITGKGRCNLTNNCERDSFFAAITRNGKFLYSAYSRFDCHASMAFFEGLGVPLKTERGGRVFPQSDRAGDIVDALFFRLRHLGVELLRGRALDLLIENGRVIGVRTMGGPLSADAVIVATGGASYPRTGSTGDGYRLAEQAGHTIVPIRPSLVPLESDDPCCGQMQGLSLRNVTLRVKDGRGKAVYCEQGELLFTHFGLSGPLVLSASAHMDFTKSSYTAHIDLKPALDEEKLDARLLRDIGAHANQNFSNMLGRLVPQSMIPVIAARAGIPMALKVHDMRREDRRRLLEALKDFSVAITGPRPVEEAIITAGGVKTSQLDPSTMASKLIRGLYFAGEVLDVDAYTGGFNLQIAWCTGRAAGIAAAAREVV